MKKLTLFAILLSALTALPVFADTAADYRAAAERGDARAQYNIGVCYYNGYGVSQDVVEAVKWWRKAARQGNQRAKKALNVLGVAE